jgi:hypothetical protein
MAADPTEGPTTPPPDPRPPWTSLAPAAGGAGVVGLAIWTWPAVSGVWTAAAIVVGLLLLVLSAVIFADREEPANRLIEIIRAIFGR